MTAKETEVARYHALGYTEPHLFPGEYTLLMNPKTLDKVRVYDDGRVWLKDPVTGEYKLVQ